MGQRGCEPLSSKFAEKFSASILFLLASLLTGLMSAVAFGFVWANQRRESLNEPHWTEGYLANESRALNFYKIFSVAYDFLNPYLYTDAMRREMVDQIGDGVGLRVLDVGCGTGYTTAGVLKRGNVEEAVGLDMNPVQLKRARRNLRGQKRRVSISRGDADKLPFVDESFDAVISVGAIEYFPDPDRTVKEFARVVKKGGAVVLGGPELGWFRKIALNRVFYTPSAEEISVFLRKADLAEVQSHLTGVKTFFGTEKYVVYAIGKKQEMQV